jgi:hypothetical protein
MTYIMYIHQYTNPGPRFWSGNWIHKSRRSNIAPHKTVILCALCLFMILLSFSPHRNRISYRRKFPWRLLLSMLFLLVLRSKWLPRSEEALPGTAHYYDGLSLVFVLFACCTMAQYLLGAMHLTFIFYFPCCAQAPKTEWEPFF